MKIGQSLWDRVELGIGHLLCVEGTMLSLSWVLGSESSPWIWIEVTFREINPSRLRDKLR